MSEQKQKNSLSRRDFLRLSAGGLGAAAFAGSIGKLDPVFKPFAQGEVTGKVEIWGYNGTIDHFKAAKDDLEKKYPGLQIVTQEWQYDEAHANVLNALTSGQGVPDIVNFDVDYTGGFGAGLTDLTERFKPYADQYVEIALKLGTYQGKLVGVPQDNEPMGLAYNKATFDKYGITEDDLATWEGYVEAGKKLWKDSGQKIKMISMDTPGSQMPVEGVPHQIHEVFLHLAGYHGVFFDKDDTKVIIDEPDAIAAIKVFKTICDPAVSWTSQTTDASLAAYKAGLVATNIFPAWWQLAMPRNMPDQKGQWRAMELPALQKGGPRAAFQIPTVTGIPAQAPNPNAAWGVLYDAQLSEVAQQKFFDLSRILPTHKKVVARVEDTPIEYFGGQKVYALLDSTLKDLPYVSFGKGWPEARAILTVGIEPIMRGEKSVEDGLHDSAEEMRRKLNKK
jgi:ABC-type glycerol-3-phosphate transport system substrate-binding protein